MSAQEGCLPGGGSARGVSALGCLPGERGICPGEISAWGVSTRECLKGDLSRGDFCLGGVYQGMSFQGGGVCPSGVSTRHPHMDRMTDACKNIT